MQTNKVRPISPPHASEAALPAGGYEALPDISCLVPKVRSLGPADRRRVGVEIEFGGLSPEAAAACVADVLGGRPERLGPGNWWVSGGRHGDVKIYLDTAWRPSEDSALARAGVELGRSVVPVEIVTEPLPQSALPEVGVLIGSLDEAGAEGTEAGLLRGYGLHLNIELADPEEGADMARIALAYGLLEGWLRHRDPLDTGRRMLPFVDPWPTSLTADLAAEWPDLDRQGLLEALHRHISSRNYGLDLLPAWASVAREDFTRWMPEDSSVTARPAYHYRLPDCRIGSPGWSLAYEWNRWVLIERLAADSRRLTALCHAWWLTREAPLVPDRGEWFASVTRILGPLADLAPEGGPDASAGA
ncbi:amidoligase family protein [Tropicimonas sediminicola]|uniref:Putative amidoligase enzyme n=1 Tax=Tropicimonas sediminicola TaxID=1031541 RepID=A0A239KZ42_9RHOB|nr:amidoligase family protein [Tropicimonas sediminicola]SNT23022.1 Putative amidoligase enzyme [Tropicimonas sediminicola]